MHDDQVLGRESGEEEPLAHMNEASDHTREMQRFYILAKRQAWKVEQLSWGQIPPVPEGKGSGENRARRMAIWRSVVTQQLQADTLASLLSSQLLAAISTSGPPVLHDNGAGRGASRGSLAPTD